MRSRPKVSVPINQGKVSHFMLARPWHVQVQAGPVSRLRQPSSRSGFFGGARGASTVLPGSRWVAWQQAGLDTPDSAFQCLNRSCDGALQNRLLHWPQPFQLDRDTVIHTESADLHSRSDRGSSNVGNVQQVSNAATAAQAAAKIAGGSKASPLGSRGSGMAGALNRALGSAKKAVGAASWRRSHAGWVVCAPHLVADHRQLLCSHAAASTWCEPCYPPWCLLCRTAAA